jgi:signal peptidase
METKKADLKKLSKIGKVLYWAVFTILIAVAAIVAVSVINVPGNYKLLVVHSGSMEPAVHTGSIVLTMPQSDYKKGDVITFKVPEQKDTLTHRIHEVIPAGSQDSQGKISSEIRYVTKGDANKTPEPTPFAKSEVVGKIVFSIPLIGYLVAFEKTLPGLILLIIIPAVIIVYRELINIKNELVRVKSKRRENEIN